ncbi:hypothetical protein MASR2M12_26390 [Bacteroidales bacterium]
MSKNRPSKKEKVENEEPDFEKLVIDDFEYQTLFTKKYIGNRAYKSADPRLLTAFIPGLVTDILVQPGQEVKKGELMAVLEAMKMLNEICAPFDAKVKAVHAEKGEKVIKNQLIIELE